jgi:outer membrane protein W
MKSAMNAVANAMEAMMQMRAARLVMAGAAAAAVLALAPGQASADAGQEPWWKRRIYLRGIGVAHVATLEQSREMELADIDGAASLAVENGPIPGSAASADSMTIFAFHVGFRLPVLNDRLSLELVGGTPAKVKFRATGTLAMESIAPEALGIPTGVPPLGEELGEMTAVPIVTTAVYQFRKDGLLRPYAGAGIAVMFGMEPTITNPILTEVSQPDFEVKPAPGIVVQGGLDIRLLKDVYARFDIKYIAAMLARAEVHHAEVRAPALPLFDAVEVGTAKMSLWVNPLIIQAGLGIDFTIF